MAHSQTERAAIERTAHTLRGLARAIELGANPTEAERRARVAVRVLLDALGAEAVADAWLRVTDIRG